MPLTYSDPEPSRRTFWQSPNGKWRIERIAHNGRRWYQLTETRRPALSKPHPDTVCGVITWTHDGALVCDHPDELPAYVVAALYAHTPGRPTQE